MTLPTTETTRSTDDEIIDSISASYDFGWHDSDEAGEKAKRGLDEQVVREISAIKGEPEWMLAKRLKAYSTFERKPMPTWGVDLSQLDMDAVKYYVRSTDRPANSWDDLPEDIKNTYDRIGIPEADRPNIFNRFYRVDKARSREHGGSGLGLSIVHDAAALYGGTVAVDGVEPHGTRFTVTFPRAAADDAPETQKEVPET